MQFLKTLFWVVVTAILMIFSMRNWEMVSVKLWGALAVDMKLPLLLLLAFIAGFIPGFLMLKAARWTARRKLESANRALDDLRAQLALSAEPYSSTPETGPDPVEPRTILL